MVNKISDDWIWTAEAIALPTAPQPLPQIIIAFGNEQIGKMTTKETLKMSSLNVHFWFKSNVFVDIKLKVLSNNWALSCYFQDNDCSAIFCNELYHFGTKSAIYILTGANLGM